MNDGSKALAERIRKALLGRDPKDPFITYQALAGELAIPPPGTIRKVTNALEQLMREDVAAGRPMIASLVISRTEQIPRRGFFDLAVALGRFPDDPGLHHAAWKAECAAIGLL